MLAVDERYMTLPELAERLKVSRQTVYRWVRSGDLHAYKVGHDYRITESDLKEFLQQRSNRPER
jgi:excisionase family DNA binding protein